jgi:hypothetical protein
MKSRRNKMETRKMITQIVTVIVLLSLGGAALGTTYYVKTTGSDNNNGTSWPQAFATIQKGIDTAKDSNVVEVNEGTYYECIDFKGYSTDVQSTDYDDWNVVNATVIDANGDDVAVTFDTSEGGSSKLLGFTVTGADDHGIECDDADPTIKYCLITANGDGSDDGAGMLNDNGADPEVTYCIFHNNDGDDGGAICNKDNGTDPEIESCLFVSNTGDDGGAVVCMYGADPEIRDCTFYDNYSDNDGGALSVRAGSNAYVRSCIFWGNDADDDGDEIYDPCQEASVEHCDVEGGWPGDDNINCDPDFADPNDPNGTDNVWGTCDDGLSLTYGSCCIDAGSGCSSSKDLCGKDRCMDGDADCNEIVDIGAYEIYGPDCWNCATQCHGDPDCSGFVNLDDLSILKAGFGTEYGDPDYNPCTDFDKDGDVDDDDKDILVEYFGTSPDANCPCGGTWPPQ